MASGGSAIRPEHEASDERARYQILTPLRDTHAGALFEAVSRVSQTRLAVLQLDQELAANHGFSALLLQELQPLLLGEIPGVVDVHEAFQGADGQLAIGLGALGLMPLSALLPTQAPLAERAALRLCHQITTALLALAQRGVSYHGDVHPGNLLVPPETRLGEGTPVSLRLIDLGLGRAAARYQRARAAQGRVHTQFNMLFFGDAACLSPEQCRGDGDVDESSDVYALGILLFTLLAGRPPFLHDDLVRVLAMHLEQPPDIDAIAPRPSPPTGQILALTLAKARAARPTVAALRQLLEQALGHPDAAPGDTRPVPAVSTALVSTLPPTLVPPALPGTATQPSVKHAPAAPVARCGPYLLQAYLGGGGMAEVYAATRERDGQRFAIKLLKARFLRDREVLGRFIAERATAQRIDHPGVVRVLGEGSDRGRPYLVMELLDGETLEAYLDAHRTVAVLPALAIAQRVAEAAAAAHAQGVVHRDLKPSNVMLLKEPAGALKLLDFGIARVLVEYRMTRLTQVGGHTNPGVLLGTLGYMAPEQWLDNTRVDGKADVFALGVILYQMLCGHLPFLVDGVQAQILRRRAAEPPPPPPWIPAPLASLLTRMMAVSPQARPTMAEVVALLAAVERGIERPARPRLSPWAAPLLLATAGAMLAAWSLQGRNPPPPPPEDARARGGDAPGDAGGPPARDLGAPPAIADLAGAGRDAGSGGGPGRGGGDKDRLNRQRAAARVVQAARAQLRARAFGRAIATIEEATQGHVLEPYTDAWSEGWAIVGVAACRSQNPAASTNAFHRLEQARDMESRQRSLVTLCNLNGLRYITDRGFVPDFGTLREAF